MATPPILRTPIHCTPIHCARLCVLPALLTSLVPLPAQAGTAGPETSTRAPNSGAPDSALAQRLRGCWTHAPSGRSFRFDGPRCVVAYGLNQNLLRVVYDDRDGTITRRGVDPSRDDVATSRVVFSDDGTVSLVPAGAAEGGAGSGDAVVLSRSHGPTDPVPLELRTEAMEFGTRTPEQAERDRIVADLVAREAREQEVRRELDETEEAVRARMAEDGEEGAAFRSPEVQAVLSRMIGIDRDNSRHVLELLRDVGWIDSARFGDAANRAAFLIVQHCGHLGMLRATSAALRTDFDAGHAASGPRHALMDDRLRLKTGSRQRYGSQVVGQPDGTLAFAPLEDPAGVDARRAAVGLPSLADYAARFEGRGQRVVLPAGYPGEDRGDD